MKYVKTIAQIEKVMVDMAFLVILYPFARLVDCTWGEWTQCENDGRGNEVKTRKIVQQAKFGGNECGGSSKQRCGEYQTISFDRAH